ncbi:MAG: hypothetical protein R6X02_09310 [Enhygromyxa sp.]
MRAHASSACPPQLVLVAAMLGRYLTYLARRPISHSNRHFIAQRLAGLEPLIDELVGRDSPMTPRQRQRLRALTPASLSREVPELSAILLRFGLGLRREGLVRSRRSPPRSLVAELEQLLVLFGPAIGIGDEIACAQLVDSFRSALPEMPVTVMSSYAGLWDQLGSGCSTEAYTDSGQLLAKLRGAADARALTILIDFEDPGLLDAVVGTPGVGPYVEVALAAQRVRVWDPADARVYTFAGESDYDRNLYTGLGELTRWTLAALAAAPQQPAFERPRLPAKGSAIKLLVTPFTSKYDPQLEYWERLLSALVAGPNRVRLRIEPGTNPGTVAFARALAKSLQARCSPGSTAGLLAPTPVSLDVLLGAIADADVVLGVDTFAAHAAPRLGTTSVILASAGLEFWRAPGPYSFYLPETAPVPALAAAIELLLEALDFAPEREQRLRTMAGIGRPMLSASEALTRSLAGHDADARLSRWRSYHGRWCELIDRTRDWPGPFATLLADFDYGGSRGDPSVCARGWDPDLDDYARATLHMHSRSNLSKYVDLCTTRIATS